MPGAKLAPFARSRPTFDEAEGTRWVESRVGSIRPWALDWNDTPIPHWPSANGAMGLYADADLPEIRVRGTSPIPREGP